MPRPGRKNQPLAAAWAEFEAFAAARKVRRLDSKEEGRFERLRSRLLHEDPIAYHARAAGLRPAPARPHIRLGHRMLAVSARLTETPTKPLTWDLVTHFHSGDYDKLIAGLVKQEIAVVVGEVLPCDQFRPQFWTLVRGPRWEELAAQHPEIRRTIVTGP